MLWLLCLAGPLEESARFLVAPRQRFGDGLYMEFFTVSALLSRMLEHVFLLLPIFDIQSQICLHLCVSNFRDRRVVVTKLPI